MKNNSHEPSLNEMAKPDDRCSCDHMLKSHTTSHRWNKKKGDMDVRLKCRYCKCNIFLEPYRGYQS